MRSYSVRAAAGDGLLDFLFAVSLMHQTPSSSRDIMTRRTTISLIVTALLVVSLSASRVVAQSKQRVSLRISSQNLKFEAHQSIEVGDAPNHIVRVFDLHYTVPNDSAPLIGGVRLKEVWQRGTADIADGVGTTSWKHRRVKRG
jgi:hypothetical protein